MRTYVDVKCLLSGVHNILNSCQKIEEYSVCLQSLLSIIDICADRCDNLATPKYTTNKNGKKIPLIGKRYKEFCDKYFTSRFFLKLGITSSWIYSLRCSVLHAGNSNCNIVLHGTNISIDNSIIQVSLTDLCYELLTELETYTGLAEKL